MPYIHITLVNDNVMICVENDLDVTCMFNIVIGGES